MSNRSAHRLSSIAALVALLLVLATAGLALAADPLELFGTDGNDTINGTAAAESIYARAGNDIVNAGDGDDELDGGAGADALRGGGGRDVVSYEGGSPVTVTLDDKADDGASGEGDNVAADVEDVIAGDGADKLVGSASGNTLDGGAGDDSITGGTGSDVLIGGADDDTINARDGVADSVDCGGGKDTAIVDRIDATTGCEGRELPPVTRLFGLSYTARPGVVLKLRLTSVALRSRVVVACISGCRGQGGGTRVIVRKSVRSFVDAGVNLRLPGSPRVVAGAVIEVRVVAPGAANKRCVVVRFENAARARRFLSHSCSSATSS